MTDEFSIPMVELISTTLLIFNQQKKPDGKVALMMLMTVLLRNHPVPQVAYDKVFKLALGDKLFENHAFVLYPRAGRFAKAIYRIQLIGRGEWTKLQSLVHDMAIPLNVDEILAVSRAMCTSRNLLELTSFQVFVRSHATLPGAMKSTICCYLPLLLDPKTS